jgi:hypothetical protein
MYAIRPILCLCRNKKNGFKEFKRKGNENRKRKQPKELQQRKGEGYWKLRDK